MVWCSVTVCLAGVPAGWGTQSCQRVIRDTRATASHLLAAAVEAAGDSSSSRQLVSEGGPRPPKGHARTWQQRSTRPSARTRTLLHPSAVSLCQTAAPALLAQRNSRSHLSSVVEGGVDAGASPRWCRVGRGRESNTDKSTFTLAILGHTDFEPGFRRQIRHCVSSTSTKH